MKFEKLSSVTVVKLIKTFSNIPYRIVFYRNIWLENTHYNFCHSANMLSIKVNVDFTVHNTVLLDIWWNMLIKFSKQITNTFAKIIHGYKGEFKILLNI